MTYLSLLPPLLLLGLTVALGYVSHRSRLRTSVPESWAPTLVSASCLAVIAAFTMERSGPIWDSETYVLMAHAGGLLKGNLAPFCFRILTPAIAHLIPVKLALSFEIINQVSLFGAGLMVYHLLRARGLCGETALLGPCVILLSSFTKFVLWYRFGVDQLALLGIVAVAWALTRRRFGLGAILATISALNKESIFLLIPFAYGELRNLPGHQKSASRRFLATLLFWSGALAAFVVLRVAIPHALGDGPIATVIGFAGLRLSSPKAYCELLLAVPKTFGAIPLILLLAWRSAWPVVQKEPYAAATVAVLLLAGIFGASDYERVYFLAVPFVLIICLRWLERYPPSAKQAAAIAVSHLSLLDVASPPDFMNLNRWFMTNTDWFDIAKYATTVLIWCVVLRLLGLGRQTTDRPSSVVETTSRR
jgi:hypothetical protein